MSAPQSDRRLRNRIHDHIAALHNGGQLAVPSAVRDYLSEHVIQQAADEYRAQRPDAPADGHAAIITAGVPGAGKSSALNTIADGTDGYRRIDPDEIKDILLVQLEKAGLLDVRHRHVLADGKTVSPGELAAWVHNASTAAADRVRGVSLYYGENFVMEGTLSWQELSRIYVDDLATHDYERLTIIDIEVPRTVAVEQSKERWWRGRRSGRVWRNTELGGRFISDDTIEGYYTGARTASTCAANARKLYGNANEAGIESELLVVSRTASGTEYRARLTADRNVEGTEDAPFGAVCLDCGAILRDPTAILEGIGRSRTRRRSDRL